MVAGLNLLTNRRIIPTPFKRDETTTNALRRIILIVSILFGILILVNYLFFILLNNQKAKQNDLVRTIVSKSSIQAKAEDLSWKTFYYKELLKTRKLLSPKAAFVYSKLGEMFTISSVTIKYPNFELTAKARSLYDFTKLIMEYLNGDLVSEISLKSAYLDTQTGEFEVTLGGTFK